MSPLHLERCDVSDLEIYANERDILQDLDVFLDYVRSHSIKRSTRSNQIPKPDAQRIARLLGDREMEQDVKADGGAPWIDYLDRLAREMGLTHYDVKGKYLGYSSASPSYIDNFIQVDEKAYQNFLSASPAHQEKRVLNALVTQKQDVYGGVENEFFHQGVLGRLDPFYPFGAATGVMPTLDFGAIRRFLLELLSGCEAGAWYSTASLVAYLKVNHPYFLIPQKLQPDRWGKVPDRYSNFHDGANRWGDKAVPADAPDAFERVEGRFVERFLEGIPLVMRFAEVAYPLAPYEGSYPMIGRLAAFRLSERFTRLMKGLVEPPRVSVLPNFDVVVESEIYPLSLMRQLERLAERVSAPVSSMHGLVITLQLKKERIAAELARNPGLDVAALLRQWSQRDLPANVAVELEAWSGHADQFVLYIDFGLLESAAALPQVEAYTAEAIGPGLRLVRQPADLYHELEEAALVPLAVQHGPQRIQPLPQAASTSFPHTAPAAGPAGPQPLAIERSTLVSLHFANEAAFEDFRKALAEARCPIQVDVSARVIRYGQHFQAVFDQVCQQLAGKYQVQISDYPE